MPVLFRDTVTRQPQYPAGINWGNQLTNGLTGAYGADRRNVVTGIPATSVTAATGANRFGRSLVFAGGTEVAQYDATLQPTVPFTALTVMVPNFSSASTTRQGIWHFQASAGSIQNRLRLIWLDATNGFYIDTNGGFAYRCTPTFSAGDPLILAYTRAGVSASNQFYVNGLAQSTTLVLDSSATAGMPTAVPLWLGDDVEASGRRLNGAINLHLHFSRTLAASEVKSLSDNPWQIYRPPARKLWLMGAASGGTTVAPSKGALTFTGKQPSIAQTANQTVQPAKGALTFTGKQPTVAQSANQTVAPSKGAITFAGKQPTVTQTANQTVAPSKGALTFTGKQPTVSQDSGTVVAPSKGALTFQGGIPSIAQTANQIVVPSKGSLVFVGKTPTVEQSGAVTFTRAPGGGGYPATVPTTERYGMINTKRQAMNNTRR